MSHLLGHWLSKWAPMEATKHYPQWCDAIDDKSVSLISLLFLLLCVIPLQALLSL